jgi:hypothetical protein
VRPWTASGMASRPKRPAGRAASTPVPPPGCCGIGEGPEPAICEPTCGMEADPTCEPTRGAGPAAAFGAGEVEAGL